MNKPPKGARGKDGEQDVEVILVVKGAGLHQPGDVLQQFIRGFWPAVNVTTKIDGVPQTANTMRLLDLDLEEYDPPAHVDKEQAKLVEIGLDPLPGSNFDPSTKHVWIKEAYWELGGEPPGKWRSLLNEWQMASYALTAELYGWLKSIPLWPIDWLKNRINRRNSDSVGGQTTLNSRISKLLDRIYRWCSRRDFVYNYMAYWLFYMLLFWVLFAVIEVSAVVDLAPNFKSLIPDDCHSNLYSEALCLVNSIRVEHLSFWIALSLAVILAWAPAYRIVASNPASPSRPPRIPPIIQVLMIVAILWNNWLYLALILFLVAPLIIGNINRWLWWKHRADSNTDRRYHLLRRASGTGGAVQTELLHIYPDLVVYRLLVLLFLPAISLALFLAQILITTRVLGELGRRLDQVSSNLLGRHLGDVSIYAMDPSTAVQVRSAVEYEIEYFHNMDRVRNIHVFAHSQGTPISFETLFNHMPKAYRSKIKTYVTVGSVLGLYYVIAPVLDEVPLPGRFRKTNYEKKTFADEFRWFNCWNLLDNVTSFCGLDTYDRKLHEGGDTTAANRLPTNIRTRTRGHSEYWSNLKEVQIPFARRVIEDAIDEKWTLSKVNRTLRHAVGEILSWLTLAVGFFSLLWIFRQQIVDLLIQDENRSLWEFFIQLWDGLKNIDFIQPIIESLGDWLSPLGMVLNDDGQRTLLIMGILIIFGVIEVVRSIFVWRGSKPTAPGEA